MTKDQLAAELKDKVKEGVKPSDIKRLKKSKSLNDIPVAPPLPPLPRSKSQLDIPDISILKQPTPQQQISQLQDQLKFQAQTSQNYLKSLQLAQAKISELEELPSQIKQLEEQILQLRCDKIKEFADYLEKKQDLESELELNINTGIKEIQRLENKLIATNKKKFELQQQLGQAQSKNANLELQMIDNLEPRPFNYWPVIALVGFGLALWLFNQKQE